MDPERIALVIRLRASAVEEARRAYSDCLAAEDETRRQLAELAREEAHQREAAESLTAGDDVVASYAAWMSNHRRRVALAEAVAENCAAETGRARAGLTAARAAHEAAEKIAERLAEEKLAAERAAEQRVLDEYAARRPPPNEP